MSLFQGQDTSYALSYWTVCEQGFNTDTLYLGGQILPWQYSSKKLGAHALLFITVQTQVPSIQAWGYRQGNDQKIIPFYTATSLLGQLLGLIFCLSVIAFSLQCLLHTNWLSMV